MVRGAGVASGYWSGGELRPVAKEEGWYHTGDIGELDAHGNLYFKARKKDVIVTPAGMNVYPEDLESALRRLPEVKDAVVVPLARDGNAEPCAVLILRDGSDPEIVTQHANQSLAEYQRIHRWLVWPEDDFPRTSTQKPRINLIIEAVQKHFAGNSGMPVHANPLADLIQRVTGRAPSQLSASSNLEADLNLSSLDRVALLSAVEDRYQVDLGDTRFSSINTIGDLERALHGEAPPRVHYHYPHWVQRWPITWIRFLTNHLLLLPAVFILGWPGIEGRENLRDINGPVLVICNHIGDVDPGFVIAALPARLRNRIAVATGGETLESYRTPRPERNAFGRIYDRIKWTLGVSLLNLFPLPREAGFRESFAYAAESVDRGYSVLVFPEGRHTPTGKLQPFRAGIGLLANSLRIRVVPMRIEGLFEIKQAGRKFAPPGTIRVTIGSPVEFSSDADPQWIAQELERIVAEL
jgi:long-chain acyl-CoA synthetase